MQLVFKQCKSKETIIDKGLQIATQSRHLEKAIRKIEQEAKKRDLTINQKKKQYMEINKGKELIQK